MAPVVSEEYKEKKKKEILVSALACFAKKGFEAATIDDIVAHSGISKGSIYNYFKSKDEIYLALMTKDTNETYEALIKDLSQFQSSIDKLDYLFTVYLKLDPFSGATKDSNIVHYEFKLHSSRSDELISVMKARRKEYFIGLVGGIITEGQETGELKREKKASLLSEVFWCMVDGVTLQTVYDDFPYHDVLREMRGLFLAELKA